MPTPIRQHIDGLELPAFMDALKKVRCDATFFRGKFFRFNGYEGDISYNEIVRTVYDKARVHGGEVKGKDLYNRLKSVERLSDQALAKKSLWVKVAAKVISFFTNWGSIYTLSQIKDMCGKNSLGSYLKQHSSSILQHLGTLGYPITSSDITIQEHNINTNGNLSQTVTLSIGDYTIPNITSSETKNFRKQFEDIIGFVKNTFPHWEIAHLKVASFGNDLTDVVQSHLRNVHDFHAQFQYKITPRMDNQQKAILDFNCTLHIEYAGTRSSLRLPPYSLLYANEPNYQTLLNHLRSAIDEKLPPFLQKQREPSENPVEDIFKNFFGKEFDDIFGAEFKDFFGGFSPQEASKAVPIEQDLTEIETLAGQPGSLCTLYQQKNYNKLQDELRKAFKKASLLYHPDRQQKPGITEQQKKEAEEKFKRFGASLERVRKTLERMTKAS